MRRVLLLVVGLATAAALLQARHLIGFRWDWVDGETINAFFARRLANGGDLYTLPSPGREAFPIYTPGYYWAITPLQAIWPRALWPEHLLSLASMAVAAVSAAGIARRLGADRLLAAASGLALFTFLSVFVLETLGRPDPLALACGGLALWSATAWEDDRTARLLWLSAAATVAMVLVKHNFVLLGGALLLAIAFRDRGAALRWTLGAAGLVVVLLAVAQVASSGAMLHDLREFSTSGYSLSALRGVAEGVLLPYPNPILAVGAIAAVPLLRERRAVGFAWLAGLGVALSAVKVGSSVNYFVLLDFVSAALLGAGLRRMPAEAMIAVALLLLPNAVKAVDVSRTTGARVEALDAVNAQAVAAIRATPGSKLITRPDLAVRAGIDPTYDPAVVAQRAAAGTFDPAPYVERLRRGDYALLVTSFDVKGVVPDYQGIPTMPPAMARAAAARYCPAGGGEGAFLYRPC